MKFIAQVFFVIIFFSTAHGKISGNFNQGEDISNYFSGILSFNNSHYTKSTNYFKKLNGLEKRHKKYSTKYLYSLVNSGKFKSAFDYARKLERDNLNTYESELIIGLYYLKNKNYKLANEYFFKLKKREPNFLLDKFVVESLLNWTNFPKSTFIDAQQKINLIDEKFKNLKNIQNAFLHCFFKSKNTDFFFQQLGVNDSIDYSRYNYFHSLFLINNGKINEAKKVIDTALLKFPRNILLNQLNVDLKSKKLNINNNFSCENTSHVIAEIFYIAANALSTQSLYNYSNFFINLSKYLNKNFISFNTLLAENYIELGKIQEAKRIYDILKKEGLSFNWYASKQNSKILIEEEKKDLAFKTLKKAYYDYDNKNIYVKLDYAKFLKNNDKFREAIKIYTELINAIKKDHPLFAQATDGRGVSYERIGEWDKAEIDLLLSLKAKPDQAYVINYLAYSWIEQGVKIEKSLQMLKKANNLKSNDPFIIDSLGWALFKLGNFEDSKKYLQTAVELLPSDPTVNDHYGDVLWKTGNTIQARYFWSYVLNLKETKEDIKKKIKVKLISGI